eukprot:TRINITY_DN10348_c0_g1_i1.p2 TRINITY_DN10348_c0_g1~~TRINITY_DN10348_c0_g1_i1.p2  ORF type:complete len:335 (+),score=109.45 TRINITY_DN10348_c0_g1_i1:78-1007(+)
MAAGASPRVSLPAAGARRGSGGSDMARALVGGAVAQTLEVITVGHLLDRVKVEQQSLLATRRAGELPGTAACARRMYARGGFRELYRGLGCNVALGCAKGASRWCVIAAGERVCRAVLPAAVARDRPCLYNAAVGVVAGTIETTFVVCPLESAKVWQMTRAEGGQGNSLRSELRRDPLMLWRGWSAQLVKQVVTWAVFLATYEKVRQAAFGFRGRQLSTADKACVGAATGALASLLHAPADLAKTLSQAASSTAVQRGMWRSLQTAHRRHGFLALFSGTTAKICRNVSSTSVTLVTMDYLDCLPQGMKL